MRILLIHLDAKPGRPVRVEMDDTISIHMDLVSWIVYYQTRLLPDNALVIEVDHQLSVFPGGVYAQAVELHCMSNTMVVLNGTSVHGLIMLACLTSPLVARRAVISSVLILAIMSY